LVGSILGVEGYECFLVVSVVNGWCVREGKVKRRRGGKVYYKRMEEERGMWRWVKVGSE
jgi:hypothetical protein